MDDEEVVRQVQGDIEALSALVGYPVRGGAYPCNRYNDRVVDLIATRTDAKFMRTTVASHNFELQTDLLRFRPTVHHTRWEELFQLGKEFIELKPETPKLFYVWGHAYEFDIDRSWDKMEEFCKLISGHDDIFYGTNSEVLFGD